MHTTSLAIKQDVFELIEDKAAEMNISVTELIKHLIARFSRRYTCRLEYRECSVAYQPPMKECHLFIITYTDEEYEQVLDMRKVWKVSVSFFVLLAFLHFLYSEDTGNPVEIKQALLYSYMLTDYVCQTYINKNSIVFTYTWGKRETRIKRE